ncbi:RNA polymerase sigma factor [Allorhizocola rhizosphaerae]|uniref:RNA polymerase sigma factor n=1 Tax=Allorhizocola rhizosphaerae TaxID=1872709 RepID=UPI000E3BB60B|nr:sigma-70 family RNA polymerase sigma factor [Allorhizocola rhizosphaerae]
MNTDEAQLSEAIVAAQEGDEDAFRSLYRATQPLLRRYLWVLVGDEAEDVASEAWLHIVRDLSSFRGDYDKFRGWAATVARNRAIDHIRRQRRRPYQLLPESDLPDAGDGPDAAELAADAIATQQAVALIARLPRDQAEAVMLRAVMGLDTHAAGRVVGKRPGAIRVNALRGLRRLAEYLRATPGQDDDPHPPTDWPAPPPTPRGTR